jgi:RNA polymerase sigma-70 factor (ECF subfamily)
VTQPPDEQAALRSLLDAAVNGDDRALGELVRRTQPIVWRVCTILGSPDEVEDLVQETYLRAMRSLTSFRGEAPVQAWLLAIARNVCADHVRRRTRRTRLVDRLRAERTEYQQEPTTALDELVRSLAANRREAFVLTQVCGLSYAEAAEVMDCPIGTVRSRVARARADLLDLVEQAEAR